MNQMKALHYESVERMISKLDAMDPAILDMSIGEFKQRACPGGDLERIGQI
eukprot:CAMPEP_0185592132 /NCGR_PEP_ID=MMETSP0434-20130131/66927_1 /TAXON_ID=626734 ORGANISM="Favella taraikaensis, Strain Fe Narragansett Bay" /NCGR_SAMPLE_ID=MMETSP0434 /ASSEMBLY_ACC=CAM_ASM_000379 /LENGTH=50 /DNA_ID=CAMNT_0028217701 /DNA_START=108 /DNA_END=260 /DNA_ORIENTATION=+